MIISASRRTDIPAFYSEWFMNRVREGYLFVQNPFNAKQVRRVSLALDDVDAIVFWTRNPAHLVPHLAELDEKGYRYYFHYTITGFSRTLERSVPRPQAAIDTFIRLSELIGPEKIIWRFDPILISSLADASEHERVFTKIATALRGRTHRVVVSFADIYLKVSRNLMKIEGLKVADITRNEAQLFVLAGNLARIAAANGMEIQSCAEEVDLSRVGIHHGKCIDADMLKQLFGMPFNTRKDRGQREECGCVASVDIGQYNTCPHGCFYCYATTSQDSAAQNYKQHDPTSPFLIGKREQLHLEKAICDFPEPAQKSLF